MTLQNNFDEISGNLEFLDDWEDRYRYLIELGNDLEPLSDEEHSDTNKVHGCVSNVWLVSTPVLHDGQSRLLFRGDSDAMIVKGLVRILIAFYSNRDVGWIADTDALEIFDRLGLREHLTSQRSNGLVAMIKRMRDEARALVGK